MKLSNFFSKAVVVLLSTGLAVASVTPANAADAANPVVTAMSADKETAAPGDRVVVTYQVTDDEDCCSYNQAWMYDPSGAARQQVTPVKVSGDNVDATYNATFTIPANAVAGSWTFKSQVYDVAGKASHLQLLATVAVDAPVEICGAYQAPRPIVSSYSISGRYSSISYSLSWEPVVSEQKACTITGYKISSPSGVIAETSATNFSGTFNLSNYSVFSTALSVAAITNSGTTGNMSLAAMTRDSSYYWYPASSAPSLSFSGAAGYSISGNFSHSGTAKFPNYSVQLKSSSGIVLQQRTVAQGSGNQEFLNLNPGTFYYVSVTPINSDGRLVTAYTSQTQVVTASVAPTARVDSIGIKTAKIVWSSPSALTGLTYTLTLNGSTQISGSTATEFEATNLAPNTTYSYVLTSRDSAGRTAATSGSFVTKDVAAPTASVSILNAYSAAISYSVPSSNLYRVSNVRVEYSTNNGSTWIEAASGTELSGAANLVDLPANAITYYRVVIQTDIGISKSTQSSFKTPDVPLPTVSLSNASGNSVDVTWSVGSWVKLRNIVLQSSSNSGATWVQISSSVAKTGTFKFSGLLAGSAYTIRAVATMTDGSQKTSSTVIHRTSSVPNPTISLSGIDGTKATINYSMPDWSNTISFEVSLYNYTNQQWTLIENKTGISGSSTATGLVPNNGYLLRAVAKLADGSTRYAESQFRTATLTVTTSVSGVSSSQATVNWSTPAWASVTGVEVQTSVNGGSTWTSAGRSTNSSGSLAITGLKSSTTHLYRVVVSTSSGTPVTSSQQSFTTSALASPTVSNAAVAGNTARVGWSIPLGTGLTSVRVQLSVSGGSFTTLETLSPDASSFTFSKMRFATSHVGRLVFVFDDGSEKIIDRTFTTAPVPTPRITLSEVGSSSGTISWDLPTWISVQSVAVQIYNPLTGWSIEAESASGQDRATIKGLKLGTSTTTRLEFTFDDGTVRFFAGPTITTTNPPTPTITGVSSTWSSATISWRLLGTLRPDRIEIEYSPVGSSAGERIVIDEFLTSYTLSELREKTRYSINVIAVYSDETERDVATFVETPVKPRIAPAKPIISSFVATGRNATLIWEQPARTGSEKVTEWEIQLREAGSNSWRTVDTVAAELTLKVSVSDLNPGRTYFAQVTAKTETGLSAVSDYKVVLIKFPMGTPGALVAKSVKFNGALLTWQQPSGALNDQPESYRVEIAIAGSDNFAIEKTSTTTTLDVSDLKSGVTYEWRVVAVSATGEEQVSGVSRFSTVTAVRAPSNLVVADYGDTWAKLQWVQLNNAAYKKVAKFEIRVSKDEGKTWETLESDLGSTVRIVTVDDLVAETEYEVRVVALSEDGDENFAQIRITTKQNLEAITESRVSLTTARSAIIQWTLPEEETAAEAIEKVSVQLLQSGRWVTWANSTTPELQKLTVSKLRPNTTYRYRVVTFGDDGYREFSAVKTFRTRR